MKSSSSQKKRKSDVNIENSATLPPKKDRPWYAEEANGDGKGDRRKSIMGLGKGLLKKIRSSSALKDRNLRESSMALASASTSAMPVFKQPAMNVTLDPMPDSEDTQSLHSEASTATSTDTCVLPQSFHRNKELVKLVANSTLRNDGRQGDSGEGISLTTDIGSSEEDVSHLSSAASLCTPSRDFGRGKSCRGSARSMPPESDLIRGLCNSAIRRTFSSVSDTASPQRFTRARSIRLREKLLLSASMAELPEEEVAPPAALDETTDQQRTPVNDTEGSSRRSSLVWSTLRSKSRIFGSRKRGGDQNTPLSMSTIEAPVTADETPAGPRALRRSSASSSSIQKRVSSALRKGFGWRGSNSNLAGDQTVRTPGTILKRSSTNSKDRNRSPSNFTRRSSDVSSVLQRQLRLEQKKKEADEAKLYMEKVVISSEPALKVLKEYDAVVVDVSATCLPVSSIAREIITGQTADELHRLGLFHPYKNGILQNEDGPDFIYIVSEKEDPPDKRARIGAVTGMREAYESGRYKKVLLYPFCMAHKAPMSDIVIQQFVLASYKAFQWASPSTKAGDCVITLAGLTEDNCEQVRRIHEELLEKEVKPKITAYSELEAQSQQPLVSQDGQEETADKAKE